MPYSVPNCLSHASTGIKTHHTSNDHFVGMGKAWIFPALCLIWRRHLRENCGLTCGKLTAKLRAEIAVYSNLVPDLIRYWIQPNKFRDLDEYVSFWIDCVPAELYKTLD